VEVIEEVELAIGDPVGRRVAGAEVGEVDAFPVMRSLPVGQRRQILTPIDVRIDEMVPAILLAAGEDTEVANVARGCRREGDGVADEKNGGDLFGGSFESL